jgi:hypothetical protein
MSSTDGQLLASAVKEVANHVLPELLLWTSTSLVGKLSPVWHVALWLLLLGLLYRRNLVARQLLESASHAEWTDQPQPLLKDGFIIMLWLIPYLVGMYWATAAFLLLGLVLEVTTIGRWILGGLVAIGWRWLVIMICGRHTLYIYGEHQMKIVRFDYQVCLPYDDISAVNIHTGAIQKWPFRILYPYGALFAAVRMRDYVLIDRKMPSGFMPTFTKQVFLTPTDPPKTVDYLKSKSSA